MMCDFKGHVKIVEIYMVKSNISVLNRLKIMVLFVNRYREIQRPVAWNWLTYTELSFWKTIRMIFLKVVGCHF